MEGIMIRDIFHYHRGIFLQMREWGKYSRSINLHNPTWLSLIWMWYISRSFYLKSRFLCSPISSIKYSNQHQRTPMVQSSLLLNVNSSCLYSLYLGVCFCEYLFYISKCSIWSWIHELISSLCESTKTCRKLHRILYSIPGNSSKR